MFQVQILDNDPELTLPISLLTSEFLVNKLLYLDG